MKGSRLRSRLPVVLKHYKLRYKMDLTLKNPPVFQEINGHVADFIDFTMQNQLFPLKSRPAYTRILRDTPKKVFGHNLCYMAPFDFSRAGFCMVFRHASYVFSCLRADLGGRGRILEPRGRHFGLGTFLGSRKR